MELDQFVGLILAVDGVAEASHFGKRDFRLGKKIIASLPGADHAVFNFTPERQAMAIDLWPSIFSPVPNAWGAKGWTRAHLPALTVEAARAAINWAAASAGVAKR